MHRSRASPPPSPIFLHDGGYFARMLLLQTVARAEALLQLATGAALSWPLAVLLQSPYSAAPNGRRRCSQPAEALPISLQRCS
jgi:hypothetical protein